MKFKSINDLNKGIEDSETFSHEIKGKRIKKELQNLSEVEEDNVEFEQFQLNALNIKLYINVQIQQKIVKFILRLDNEYPFNQPQLYYAGQDYPKLKRCKDILGQLLNEQIWGPSLTIQTFLKQIPVLAKKLLKQPNQINWMYHDKFEYSKQQLEENGVKLFEIEEYEWKYMIKSTKRKVLGLSEQSLLKFAIVSEGKYMLQWNELISGLKDIKATTGKGNNKKSKFQLTLTYSQEEKKKIMYLGGSSDELDNILLMINPIQMLQRKIERYEKENKNNEEVIECYTQLVDHYSQVDPQKTAKLIQSMKKIIEKQYSQPVGKLEEQEHAQKIQT